jgi:hypothetical protein
MELQQLAYGQRVRVIMPGIGDHGQLGTFKKMHNGWCYVHLDWDVRRQHLTQFYPEDIEAVATEPAAVLDGSAAAHVSRQG